jgi:NitT/TauT family transport system permease protein
MLLILWEGATRFWSINPIILPSPADVGEALLQSRDEILYQTAVTAFESIGGFLLGSIGAYVLAISFVFSPLLERTLYPYAIALKATPLIALAPLLVLWLGNGVGAKVVMSALVAFFPVLVGATRGLRDIDRDILALMHSLSASPMQMLRWVRIPNSGPFLFPALRVASSLAVVGAVIGEFTGASAGIGYLIKLASYNLNTALMFCGVLAVGMLGVAMFLAVAAIERFVVFWRPITIDS